MCVVNIYQSDVNDKTEAGIKGFRHQSMVLWQWVQPLWTKARYTAVGECVCQHLSQYAGWTLQSRLPTNLTDKQCHPPVSNILGGRRGHTVQNISPHPVLALPPLCYDARSLCCHVSCIRLSFFCVLSIPFDKNTHKQVDLRNSCWYRPPLLM